MRRSAEPRVPSQGEILFDASAGSPTMRAAIVNLSSGGLCARGPLPSRVADHGPDSVVHVALGLADGTPPIAAAARVVWAVPAFAELKRASDRVDAKSATFGLCFVDLPEEARTRLSAAVNARRAIAIEERSRDARLRLDQGPTLRATADSFDETGAQLSAELPWLRLGADAQAELEGLKRNGRIAWVGLDFSDTGAARLRVRVSFEPKGERREITLPYFSTEAARVEFNDGAPSIGVRPERTAPSAMKRALQLVHLGEQRKVRLAILRVAAALIALGAMFAIARAFWPKPAPIAPVTIAAPIEPIPESVSNEPAKTAAPVAAVATPAAPAPAKKPAARPSVHPKKRAR